MTVESLKEKSERETYTYRLDSTQPKKNNDPSEQVLPHTKVCCSICFYQPDSPKKEDLGYARGNTERFLKKVFPLWKCPKCLTIKNLEAVDYHDIYSDYPLAERKLDVFSRSTFKNLLNRLIKSGMKKEDRILDFGCGNHIFVDYLKENGYTDVTGYDPYVPKYCKLPDSGPYDVVINNDVIEHCDDIHRMIRENLGLLKSGGLLYIGTADSEPVQMNDLEPHLMRLHQPFHRTLFTQETLHRVVKSFDVNFLSSYERSYHDTKKVFANYRFLDELNRAVGHNLDRAMDEKNTTRTFLKTPRLWFFAFFGYWFPCAIEPAVMVRKREL